MIIEHGQPNTKQERTDELSLLAGEMRPGLDSEGVNGFDGDVGGKEDRGVESSLTEPRVDEDSAARAAVPLTDLVGEFLAANAALERRRDSLKSRKKGILAWV